MRKWNGYWTCKAALGCTNRRFFDAKIPSQLDCLPSGEFIISGFNKRDLLVPKLSSCLPEMSFSDSFIVCYYETPNGVPSKKILHWANVCFSEYATAQPYRCTTNKAFQAAKVLCDIYTILKLCARKRFHCANGLVVQRSFAPWRKLFPPNKLIAPCNAVDLAMDLLLSRPANRWESTYNHFKTTNLRQQHCHQQKGKIYSRRFLFCSNLCDVSGMILPNL